MLTVVTRLVLTNAHVKWDTLAMDTHVQVILTITLFIFPNKTNFCKYSHSLKKLYPVAVELSKLRKKTATCLVNELV